MKLYKNKAYLYDKMISATGKDYNREAEFISAIVKKRNSNAKTILDLGCGTGNYSFELVKKGFELVLGDINPEMLNIAKKKCDGKSIKIDMRSFSLKNKVDAIICMYNTLMYNLNNKELHSTLKSCYGALKEGGVLVIQLTNPELLKNSKETVHMWPISNTERVIQLCFIDYPQMNQYFIFIDKKSGNYVIDSHVMNVFSTDKIKQEMELCGLCDIEVMVQKSTLYIISRRPVSRAPNSNQSVTKKTKLL